ncbi:MAG: RluA family pseudouridine synthase [Parachlamydiaceae bacterium]|nr:RluA family pseudouridine synthase [Parachlamydiaceae bacterium]
MASDDGSKSWRVEKEESGTKLLNFLQNKLGKEISLRKLKQALEQNLCHVNRRVEHFASTVVGWGDEVEFALDKMVFKTSRKSLIPPAILYEDEDFLLIDKPSGISSEDKALLEILKSMGTRPELALAHRLDKETSGVLAFTKTACAKEALYKLFKERKVSKRYNAIVAGIPGKMYGRIDNFLGKIADYEGQNLWGAVEPEKGMRAVTDWKCINRGKNSTFIACSPLTGRTHQIRVHLASIGHPILGDMLYNKLKNPPYLPSRCLLHAAEMGFEHPFTGNQLVTISALPADFGEAAAVLGLKIGLS